MPRTYRQRKADEALEWARIRRAMLEAWARGESTTEMQIQSGPHGWGKFLSPSSLYGYSTKLYKDLDVKNQAAAVAEGIRRGFLPCPCNEPMRRADVERYEEGRSDRPRQGETRLP